MSKSSNGPSCPVVNNTGHSGSFTSEVNNRGYLYEWCVQWSDGRMEAGNENGHIFLSDFARREGFQFQPVIASQLRCYRVWYKDGSARMVDSTSVADARQLAINAARDAGYWGDATCVSKCECLE